MRLHRGLLTSVVACLTVLLIVFNSKSTVEMGNGSGSGVGKSYARGQDARRDQRYRYVTPSLAELAARGNVPKSNRHILMLTRVPEAGAELLVLILQRLQGYNAFKHIRLPPGDHGLLSTLQEELLVEEMTNIIRQEAVPLSFDGDVSFFNFSKFGRQSPSFISLVRNPVSVHHFQRYRERRKNNPEGRAIPMFCGQDPRCTEVNNKWALHRAKTNVVEWYPVVGVLDCLDQSIDLLERKFPYFFRGAKQIYQKIQRKKSNGCDATRGALKSRRKDFSFKYFEDEMEFYQWIKIRLLNETLLDLGDNSYS